MKIYKFIFIVIVLLVLIILIFKESNEEITPGVINLYVNISELQQIQNSLNNFQNIGINVNNFQGTNSSLQGASSLFINSKDLSF